MIRGMYSAISGLKQQQLALDVTANNLANVNTIGYKSSRASFQDQLADTYSAGAAAGATTGGQNARQVGLGVALGGIQNQMGAGALQSTGNPLDVAINGEGYFRVQDAAGGAPQYTRAGDFTPNDAGDIVTNDGYYVMNKPQAGNPNTGTHINIPAGASSVSVGPDGTVSYVPEDGSARTTAGVISLAKFPNEAGLTRSGGNRFQASASSGAETVGQPGSPAFGSTIGGTTEASNVDLASEFTNMITAQRGFQANSRVISTADQMLQDLVNLKN